MAKAKGKVDLKKIMKYRFWIGLGTLSLCLAVLAFFQMTTSLGAKEKKDFEDKLKSVKGLSDFKNEKFLPSWSEREEKLRKQLDEIWDKAWRPQSIIQTWFAEPFWEKDNDLKTGKVIWKQVTPTIPHRLTWNRNTGDWDWKFPSETVDGTTLDFYKDTLYITQFASFEKELADAGFPVEFGGGFNSLMGPVRWNRGTPTAEEVWISQEDFWVKREIIRDIKRALDSIALLHPDAIGKEEKTPAGAAQRKRFYNNFWELDLMFETDGREKFISSQSRVMNVHLQQRAMTLDNPNSGTSTEFLLTQGQTKVKLKVQGEPLGYGQSREFLKTRQVVPFSFDPAKDFTVEQSFSPRNSPVRAVANLALAHRSHRMANISLVSRSEEVLKKEKAEGAADPGSGGGGPMGPGGPGGPMGPGGAPGGPPPMAAGGPGGFRGSNEGEGGFGRSGGFGGNRSGALDGTMVNFIERGRYIQATKQCRHIPFGINLVVDQTVMNEILAALANSKLRVQLTQFHYQHVPGFQSAGLIAGAFTGEDPGAGGFGPGGPGGPRGPGGFEGGGSGGPLRPMGPGGSKDGGPGPGPGGPAGFGPGGPGGPGIMGPGGAGPLGPVYETNLVEFTVYGVASLFERPGAPPIPPTGENPGPGPMGENKGPKPK
ncbi:MAG: hypothetical protein EXR99_07255 [Gemmataceae bacterium]|nr:hypothetical protein [Gemmataceae bacterium]